MMNEQNERSLCYVIAPPGKLGIFWGSYFWSGDFFLGNVGRLRDFFGSIVYKPEYPPWDYFSKDMYGSQILIFQILIDQLNRTSIKWNPDSNWK